MLSVPSKLLTCVYVLSAAIGFSYANSVQYDALLSDGVGTQYLTHNPKIINREGNAIGHAVLTTTSNGSLVSFSVCDLPRGWHAVHIHNKGDCDDYARNFKSAGEIYNPNFLNHGYAHKRSKSGYSIGDLANVYVGNEPCIHIEQLIPGLDRSALRRQIKGLALIFHAHADDYYTQPDGGSGERLACAVLKRR